MIKVYGFAVSNYVNMVKVTLMEKGIEFEAVQQMPSQKDPFLATSPMGKVPCIEVDGVFITEASAIIEYAEEAGSGPSLFPADPVQRAKVRELMKYCELYCDLAVRPTFAEAFFGGSVSDEVKATAEQKVAQGIAAIGRLAKFSPYIAGEQFTAADIVANYTLPMAAGVGAKLFNSNPLDDLPGAGEFLGMMAQRDSVQAIAAAQKG